MGGDVLLQGRKDRVDLLRRRRGADALGICRFEGEDQIGMGDVVD